VGRRVAYRAHIEGRQRVLLPGKSRRPNGKAVRHVEAEQFFEGADPAAFARKSAHFLTELNAIHPFREGNGRAQLTFFLLLAARAGHRLDFERLDPGAVMAAMIASFEGDEKPLVDVIAGLLT
jgi:cell filamentation protein